MQKFLLYTTASSRIKVKFGIFRREELSQGRKSQVKAVIIETFRADRAVDS